MADEIDPSPVMEAKPVDVLIVHDGIIAYARYTAWRTRQIDAIQDLAREVVRLRKEASDG